MTILYVFQTLARFGGIERISIQKMNYLATRYSYRVFALTADQGDHPLPFSLDEAVCYEDLHIRFHQQYQYRGFRRLWTKFRLQRLFQQRLAAKLRTIHPDVIVCPASGYVATLNHLRGNIPLIVEAHSICSETFIFERMTLDKRLQTWWGYRNISRADLVVAITQGDADEWRRWTDRVCVVPNIVSLNPYRRLSDCTARRVVFAGRFAKEKDIPTLAAIWQRVHRQFPDWTLDIYGDGELKDQLAPALEAMACNICVHPSTADIFQEFLNSSIVVLTSLGESFSLVLVEAMSCGVPVVAFDCPYGPRDIITNDRDGYLIAPGDTASYSDRLCRLMADPQLRRKMGQHAASTSQRFAADVIMPQWHEIFRRFRG